MSTQTITCPEGIKYEEFEEAENKLTPLGTWMQWQAIVACITTQTTSDMSL